MALTGVLLEYSRTPHLAGLLRAAEQTAAHLRAAETTTPAAAERRRAALLASLRLDGSPITTWPDDELAAAAARPWAGDDAPADEQHHGSWFDAMRVFDDVPDELLLAREALGVAAADASDDLAEPLGTAPAQALGELHRRLTRGLVDPDRASRPRTSEQAVHDASVGRILYFTVEPHLLPAAFEQLTDWLAGPAHEDPPLLAAGLLHLEVLRLHPYDAANGRLARAASRLWLRRHGLDPDGLAVPEPALATDPLGYHEEVARSMRRRDATIWLERWAEAVVDGLRGSARALGLTDAVVDAATVDRLGATFTLPDARDRLGVADLDAARAVVDVALAAGAVERVPGSRGLRFRRATD